MGLKDERDRPQSVEARERERRTNAKESYDAWGASSLLISGLIVWGGAGALASWWLDSTWPILVGLLMGMAGALYLVWLRYGRPDAEPDVTSGSRAEGPRARPEARTHDSTTHDDSTTSEG